MHQPAMQRAALPISNWGKWANRPHFILLVVERIQLIIIISMWLVWSLKRVFVAGTGRNWQNRQPLLFSRWTNLQRSRNTFLVGNLCIGMATLFLDLDSHLKKNAGSVYYVSSRTQYILGCSTCSTVCMNTKTSIFITAHIFCSDCSTRVAM
jgi:hypothetical protein